MAQANRAYSTKHRPRRVPNALRERIERQPDLDPTFALIENVERAMAKNAEASKRECEPGGTKRLNAAYEDWTKAFDVFLNTPPTTTGGLVAYVNYISHFTSSHLDIEAVSDEEWRAVLRTVAASALKFVAAATAKQVSP